MGYPMHYNNTQEIFDELTALTPSYAGMTYERLGCDGLQWPCPAAGSPRYGLYAQGYLFSRGLGKFHPVTYQPPAEQPDKEYPFSLTTGRMFAHFHTGTMTRVSPHLDIEQQDGYVEINPKDAKKMEVKNGDMLTICSRRGELDVPARLTNTIDPGTLFLPIHFGENPANILTSSDAFDPLAKIPEFKVSAVSVRKAQAEMVEQAVS